MKRLYDNAIQFILNAFEEDYAKAQDDVMKGKLFNAKAGEPKETK